MQRITITIDDDLLAEIDAAATERGYQNRSEIIRDLARAGMQQTNQEKRPAAIAWRLWYMSTTTLRAIYRSAWWRTFTVITISRLRRYTFISTTIAAWR
jgi:Arc/MetJ-type ribon-helix-helix transcriptional regulator